MRRSGSTLQYLLTREIVGHDSAIGWVIWQEFDELVEKHDGKSEVILLKTHPFLPHHTETAGRILSEGRMYPVYVYRDLRDVLVSLLQFADGEMYEDPNSIISNVENMIYVDKEWRMAQNAHVARYENMIHNIPLEVWRIAQKIKRPVTNLYAEKIACMYTKDKVRELQPEKKRIDRTTLLHRGHVQSGEMGRWKTELKPEWLRLVEEIAEEWLVRNGYVLSGGKQ